MALVKLDSVDVELPAESAGLVMSYVRDTTSRLDTLEKDNTTLAEQLELAQAEITALTGEKEAAEGRADEFEAQLSEMEENGQARIDVAELDSLIEQRLDTLQTLAPAFPSDYVFNGKSEDDLYKEAFTNLTGTELRADADMTYVQGFVNGTLASLNTDSDEEEDEDEEEEDTEEEDDEEMVEDRADSRFLRQAVRNRAGRSDSASGYKPAIRADAWKQPLTAHRS
jgi:chromosome segregation ATPase